MTSTCHQQNDSVTNITVAILLTTAILEYDVCGALIKVRRESIGLVSELSTDDSEKCLLMCCDEANT